MTSFQAYVLHESLMYVRSSDEQRGIPDLALIILLHPMLRTGTQTPGWLVEVTSARLEGHRVAIFQHCLWQWLPGVYNVAACCSTGAGPVQKQPQWSPRGNGRGGAGFGRQERRVRRPLPGARLDLNVWAIACDHTMRVSIPNGCSCGAEGPIMTSQLICMPHTQLWELRSRTWLQKLRQCAPQRSASPADPAGGGRVRAPGGAHRPRRGGRVQHRAGVAGRGAAFPRPHGRPGPPAAARLPSGAALRFRCGKFWACRSP